MPARQRNLIGEKVLDWGDRLYRLDASAWTLLVPDACGSVRPSIDLASTLYEDRPYQTAPKQYHDRHAHYRSESKTIIVIGAGKLQFPAAKMSTSAV